jgi:hypothetical protein
MAKGSLIRPIKAVYTYNIDSEFIYINVDYRSALDENFQ